MIKKTYLKTFEQINNALHAGKVVHAEETGIKAMYKLEYGLYKRKSGLTVYYNTPIAITPGRVFWLEEEVKIDSVKPEVGFVFETNEGHQVYINLKKGNKFYGAELNGKQNSCKVFNEDGKVEKRNIYLVKKIK